jgi:hypothetical protein
MFNKKALYIYIREQIDVKTPKITKIANVLYGIFKEKYLFYLEHGKFPILKILFNIFINKTMGQLDSVVFGEKKFSDILEEIYNNQKKKEAQVTALISELKPLINEIGDATLIVPLIKEYMEIGVKNDEQLIKMATIVQRALQSGQNEDGSFGISDEEKSQLLEAMEDLQIKKDDNEK